MKNKILGFALFLLSTTWVFAQSSEEKKSWNYPKTNGNGWLIKMY